MKKFHALLMMVILCAVSSMPLMVQAQSDTACNSEPRSAIQFTSIKPPNRCAKCLTPARRPSPIRGGRDFEPGRPQPVENSNPPFTDPLADKSVGSPSALAEIKASTNGTPIDPNARVAPPDTTGDVGPNHYVQWVNLRYSIYTLTRGANNEITAFNLVPGFPKNGNVVWQGFGGRCQIRQRRRSDRAIRSTRRPLGVDSVCRFRHSRSLSAWPYRRLRIQPERTSATRSRTTELQRLSEDGRLAGCLLHHLQHVPKRSFVHRQHECALLNAPRCWLADRRDRLASTPARQATAWNRQISKARHCRRPVHQTC